MYTASPEPSPCVGICIMEGDVCIGCGRTAEEIFQAGVDAGFGGTAPPKKSDDDADSEADLN